ncbi:hypothetical protein C8J28_13916 [Cereibacter azotoformans]|uniref:Uncharacterized protein n=1 Tax=Cereibacter azotoformans TaxID=43057 RepID=A0A2T5JLJ9_9RHOB|nr:hypothetical protein C8J28_13916 [Cereibacter azotoformans]
MGAEGHQQAALNYLRGRGPRRMLTIMMGLAAERAEHKTIMIDAT